MGHEHRKIAKLTLAALLLTGAAPQAMAQDSTTEAGILEEIVVTGSRIARRDATAVGPITTMTAEDMVYAAPTSVGDLLQSLPSVGVSLNSNGTQGTSFGVSSINLRYLGSAEGIGNRTLQIAQMLRAAITRSTYKVGGLLPTEQELCATHAISRHTARDALR